MNKQTMKVRRSVPSRRGIALVLVMIAVAVATILSLTFVIAQGTSHGIAQNVQHHAQARHIAESGLAMTIVHVQNTLDWRTVHPNGQWVVDEAFAGGSFSVTGADGDETGGDGDLTDDPTDPLLLRIVGSYQGATHIVQAVLTPLSRGILLFVVPDPAGLSATDLAKQAIFESWGWEVVLADDSTSQTDLLAAADNSDVVFVSATVADSQMSNKLLNCPTGIVSEHKDSGEELELASAVGNTSDSTIDIVDNVHYITEPFATGNLAIRTSSSNVMVYANSSNVASGAQTLAEWPGSSDSGLWIADAGWELDDGSLALGRRVQLPWARSDPDPALLTNDGLTILKRSLEWAAATNLAIGAAGTDKITMQHNAVVDSFNSALGPYSITNNDQRAIIASNSISNNEITLHHNAVINGSVYIGPTGTPDDVVNIPQDDVIITGTVEILPDEAPMPTATEPTGIAANVGNLSYTSGTTSINADLQCNKLTVSGSAILEIGGDVTILAHKSVNFADDAQLTLLPGARLTLYFKSQIDVRNNSQLNVNTADASRFTIYNLTANTMSVWDQSVLYATVRFPTGSIALKDNSQLCGSFAGYRILIQDTAKFSQDTNPAMPVTRVYNPVTKWLYDMRWNEVRWDEP